MIRPEEAWQRLLPFLSPLPNEAVDRREAVGRVLATELRATVDVPFADVSAMDGFALRGDVPAGTRLGIQGTIAAGEPPGAKLAEGKAWRIMTGAPVPLSADRIIPVEQTKIEMEGKVTLLTEVPVSSHIRRLGEVARRGEELLQPGTALTPGALALIAAHGYPTVMVHRRPRVAVLATGDEVVAPDREPGPGQLRDSHTDFLLAAGKTLGLDFDSLGIAPDRWQALHSHLSRGLDYDVLLIGGGVSMGEFDLVEGVLAAAGCQVLFDAVAIQPGKPLVAAHHPRGLVFGLPGNPASVMVGFWLFVRPALCRLQGIVTGFWSDALEAELAAPLPGAKDRDRFFSAEIRIDGGRLLVSPRPPRGSHDVGAYAHGAALVRVPAFSEPARAGESCQILPTAGWPGRV